ncbi:Cuticle protein 10.9 like protein [Argiope bruennichi]|uniref:Cuticle protein 10.9 like protein n=1 Tax=Argiope bruennichi TaxID=94029 RepID=A0A8T0EKU1_ARGBR|nr:Cuticle protein 10.9 like protein [Argiope bruennichi]
MFAFVILACIVLAQGDIYRHPYPYDFGYSVKDHTSDQYRQEKGNGLGAVVGSYGFKDARGIFRNVNYVADHAGFRAVVNGNEPGTANQNPASVIVNPHQPVVVKAVKPILAYPVGVVAVPAVHRLENKVKYDGVLRYTGLLGGHNKAVSFTIPLAGGAVRGYDSRFTNVVL